MGSSSRLRLGLVLTLLSIGAAIRLNEQPRKEAQSTDLKTDLKGMTDPELRTFIKQKNTEISKAKNEVKRSQEKQVKVEDRIDKNQGYKFGRKLVNSFSTATRAIGNLESFFKDECGGETCGLSAEQFKTAYKKRFQPHEATLLTWMQEKMKVPCDQREGALGEKQLETFRHVIDRQIDFLFKLLDQDFDGTIHASESADTCQKLASSPNQIPKDPTLKWQYEAVLFSCSSCSAGMSDLFDPASYQALHAYKENKYTCGAEAKTEVKADVEVPDSCATGAKRVSHRRATTEPAKLEDQPISKGLEEGLEKGFDNLGKRMSQ